MGTRWTRSALFVVALFAMGHAQDLTQRVTITIPAAPVAQVLQKISAQSSVRLEATQALANDVVAIRLKDVPLADALKQVASVVAGEWIQIEGGYRLNRSTSLDRAEQQAEIAARATRLREAIAKLADEAKRAPAIDRETARQMIYGPGNSQRGGSGEVRIEVQGSSGGPVRQVFSASAQTPATRAIHQVLALLDVNEIAAMPRGSRQVFAFTPTSVQRPLPSACRDVIANYVEAQRIWNEVLAEGGQSGRPSLFLGGSPQATGTVQGRMAEALLVITRPTFGDGYQASLTVANEQGETMASGAAFIVPAPRPESNADSVQAPAEAKPIALSTLSKEFVELVKGSVGSGRGVGVFRLALDVGDNNAPVTVFSSGGNEGAPPKISPAWRDRLLAPDKFEPLSTVPSEAVIGIAEALDLNLVACVPDSMLIPCARSFAGGELKPSDALRQALTTWGLAREVREGWLILKPAEPYSARKQRVDRPTLGKMLRSLDARGTLTLDELAELALKQQEPPEFQGLGMLYFRLVNPAFADRQLMATETGERDMLRLWGSSSAAQRQAMLRGQPIPFGTFDSAQREILRQMVYWSNDGPHVQVGGSGAESRQGMLARGGFATGLFGPMSLSTERTEVLPNGVPSTGVLVVRVNTSPAVLARASGTTASQVMSARELAFQQARREMRGELAQIGGAAREYDEFRECTQVEMNFQFRFTPNVEMSRTLVDARFEANTRPVAYAQLSPQFRQMTERLAAQIRRTMSEARTERAGDRGGRRVPPPLP